MVEAFASKKLLSFEKSICKGLSPPAICSQGQDEDMLAFGRDGRQILARFFRSPVGLPSFPRVEQRNPL
jgi:hypothetical protein